jgi:hypothetical protein
MRRKKERKKRKKERKEKDSLIGECNVSRGAERACILV